MPDVLRRARLDREDNTIREGEGPPEPPMRPRT